MQAQQIKLDELIDCSSTPDVDIVGNDIHGNDNTHGAGLYCVESVQVDQHYIDCNDSQCLMETVHGSDEQVGLDDGIIDDGLHDDYVQNKIECQDIQWVAEQVNLAGFDDGNIDDDDHDDTRSKILIVSRWVSTAVTLTKMRMMTTRSKRVSAILVV